jgi:hypothetical protein
MGAHDPTRARIAVVENGLGERRVSVEKEGNDSGGAAAVNRWWWRRLLRRVIPSARAQPLVAPPAHC